jgi:hypothetical protein
MDHFLFQVYHYLNRHSNNPQRVSALFCHLLVVHLLVVMALVHDLVLDLRSALAANSVAYGIHSGLVSLTIGMRLRSVSGSGSQVLASESVESPL